MKNILLSCVCLWAFVAIVTGERVLCTEIYDSEVFVCMSSHAPLQVWLSNGTNPIVHTQWSAPYESLSLGCHVLQHTSAMPAHEVWLATSGDEKQASFLVHVCECIPDSLDGGAIRGIGWKARKDEPVHSSQVGVGEHQLGSLQPVKRRHESCYVTPVRWSAMFMSGGRGEGRALRIDQFPSNLRRSETAYVAGADKARRKVELQDERGQEGEEEQSSMSMGMDESEEEKPRPPHVLVTRVGEIDLVVVGLVLLGLAGVVVLFIVKCGKGTLYDTGVVEDGFNTVFTGRISFIPADEYEEEEEESDEEDESDEEESDEEGEEAAAEEADEENQRAPESRKISERLRASASLPLADVHTPSHIVSLSDTPVEARRGMSLSRGAGGGSGSGGRGAGGEGHGEAQGAVEAGAAENGDGNGSDEWEPFEDGDYFFVS